MALNKRRFIRLEEIEKRTPLTKEEVLDSIDDGELNLCAKVEVKHAGALFAVKEKPVIGAVFGYRGFVRLGRDDSKHFAAYDKEKAVEMFQILEPEKVSGWQSVTDAFGTIEKHIVAYQNSLPARRENPFWAYPEVVYDVTGAQSFGQMITDMFTAEMKEKMGDELNRLNTRYLQKRKLTIEPHTLRIDLQEIEQLTRSETVLPAPSASVAHDGGALIHPVEQIVYRVLQENPTARADKVWNIIRSEFRQAGRQYDIDGVIESMTADDIRWFGKGVHTENEMGYDAFRKNTVYKVRKLIKVD
ncbi:hypothetical protein [Vibrio quintilis]|uniref:Uncharacterized protein n=1 Tax=Vibrio quintilis TaxID=1117707 RepID=A0A1M7YZE1_9VIBR|nr:hypothetical protein [Vibrio quintilis]SHO58057.1 hypothetical protein VQ7734_03827 [Vibrio quintilis]